MNAVAVHTRTKTSWLQALTGRFAPPPPVASALVCSVIARGRQTLHGVVVLSPLPRLWEDDEDDEDDEDTECDHRAPLHRSEMG